MSFQMNLNLEFYNSGTEYDYWIQNVAFVQTSSPQSIEFIDNVWNFSSHSAEMHNSTIAGNGTVSKSGTTGYYYAIANNTLPGNDVNFVYPEEFQLKVVSEINSQGNPEVLFEYNDGQGWITYDNPSFIFTGSVTSDPGFTVNGSSYNPVGTYYDAELIMGGPGGGSNTKDDPFTVKPGSEVTLPANMNEGLSYVIQPWPSLYSTPSFLGKVNITSLNTDNKSSSSVGTEMSFQMNVNLEFYKGRFCRFCFMNFLRLGCR